MNNLDRLLDGDLSYFDEFYEETKKKVFYNIFSIVQDENIAEDILQETYIRFLNSLKKIKKESSALGYLFTISRNLSLDLIKKNKRETKVSDYEFDNFHEEEKRDDMEDLVKLAKKILRREEFEIVMMHAVNDLTHKEIAEQLKKPIGTITWAYNNAIKKLQKGLEHYE